MLMRRSSTGQMQAIGTGCRSPAAPLAIRASRPRQLVLHSSTATPVGVVHAARSSAISAALRIGPESVFVDVAHGLVADGPIDLVRGRVGEVGEEENEAAPAIELVLAGRGGHGTGIAVPAPVGRRVDGTDADSAWRLAAGAGNAHDLSAILPQIEAPIRPCDPAV